MEMIFILGVACGVTITTIIVTVARENTAHYTHILRSDCGFTATMTREGDSWTLKFLAE